MKENTKKPIILIIDDNPVNIQVVGESLRSNGYDISVALNGKKGITIAKTKHPHLILLDVMMPEMDGFEVSEILKNDEDTKDIPIIFLTANISQDDILRGFSAGAVDYITKPFNFHELLARVKTHVQLKLFSDKIEEDKRHLEKLNFEKNNFLSIAAHDLKNPIYSISMLAKVIRDEQLKREEVVEFSSDIINISDRMLELIRNLLDINAIENGKFKVDIINDEISYTIQKVFESYKERAKNKNIKLHFSNNSEGKKVRFDENALIQIADNLISNALKFSPFDKNIFVKIENDDNYLYFKVKDEGPGVTPEDMKKLFGKFTKLSARPTADENSTGLGLSIVKQYAEIMNGNVYCESIQGEGAEFILKLQLSTTN